MSPVVFSTLLKSVTMQLKIFKIFIYLFIYLAALGLSCGMRSLSCSMRAESSSPTRDRTLVPCIGSMESYPLDHQGSSCNC